MLTPFGEEIWTTDGTDVDVFGFRYPTRMAVIRLGDGGLFVWSPVRLTESLEEAVDTLGPVRHVAAPNSLHHLFLPEWQDAYPDAKLFAPPGLREKRPDISFHGDLGETPPGGWAGEIDQAVMRGNLITTEVVFFHRASGTALFTDLIQRLPEGRVSGWRRIVARLDLMIAPEPAVPRKFRLTFFNRRAAKRAVERIKNWPVRRVLIAHGRPVTEDAAGFLDRAFRWLSG